MRERERDESLKDEMKEKNKKKGFRVHTWVQSSFLDHDIVGF